MTFGLARRRLGPCWTQTGRAAQAFDFAAITIKVGAPSFAHSAKGGYHERLQWRS